MDDVELSRRAARRATRRVAGAFGLVAAALGLALPAAGADTAAAEEQRELRATGLTFVGSKDDQSELVLRSRFATFLPDRDLANLEQVEAVLNDAEDGESFEMTCDRAPLHVDTNDFRAEGNVRGTTSEGQRYTAPWVEYDHEAGILQSDAPVRMVDATGSFRGDGFRYSVSDRTFRLLGNVLVEQTE